MLEFVGTRHYTFEPEKRLRKPSEFKFALTSGQRVRHPVIHFALDHNTNRPRLGLTVPKKVLRRAHDRNRIKRLIRESFRHHQHKLPPVNIVAMVRFGIEELSNQEISEILAHQWRRIKRQHNAQ